MTKAVMLDNVTHKDLRVRTGYSAEFGDSVNLAMVFPTEFAFVQREYPILFRKAQGGEFESVALLGLDKGENLFLEEPGWNGRYVPAILQRGPFLIGLGNGQTGASGEQEPMVLVNLKHPRVSKTEGEPVFLPHGGNSPFLEHAQHMLQMIHHGVELSKPMFAAFQDAGLLESMDVEVSLNDRVKYTIPGFYTIDQDRLAQLDGAELERLNRPGFLALALHAVTSLGNLSWLVELKNRKLAAEEA
jgi:hypothetical protein